MNPVYKIIMTLTALSVLAGCAGLDFNQAAPNVAQFHPKVVVLLPITMPSHVKPEAEIISSTLANAIADTKKFDRVIDPSTVLVQMGANKQLQDDITAYLSKIQTLGVSDKELSARIAEVFHADALFVIDIPRIGYGIAGSAYDQSTTKKNPLWVGKNSSCAVAFMQLKMVDGASGTVIWRANHSGKQTYALIRPKLQDVAVWLIEYMLKYLPTS